MDQQFLAALQSLTLDDFTGIFPGPLASRLHARYADAHEVNELQLWLVSLTDSQQVWVCSYIRTKIFGTVTQISGPERVLKEFRDWLLDTNLHFIIKSDKNPKPDRTGYADWYIVTDVTNYLKWNRYRNHRAA